MIKIRDDKSEKITAQIYLEKTVYGISVKAIDTKGDDWFLVSITEQGVTLHDAVPAELGIATDEDGVLIQNYEVA